MAWKSGTVYSLGFDPMFSTNVGARCDGASESLNGGGKLTLDAGRKCQEGHRTMDWCPVHHQDGFAPFSQS